MHGVGKASYLRGRTLSWIFGMILNTSLTSCNQTGANTELSNYPTKHAIVQSQQMKH